MNVLYAATAFLLLLLPACSGIREGIIMTVNGPIKPEDAGITLTHEHLLVDFIGADSISYNRWDRTEVERKVLPFLSGARQYGMKTFIDATPEYIGRDPVLLKKLSDAGSLNIITNTGYYGAGRNRYIPSHAYKESADELAARWIHEWRHGIGNTGVRPGFIKTGVMGAPLSELHRKLITAAARAHLQTGLVIASHTGQSAPAFEQLGILYSEGVSPEAFIWVHAQNAGSPEDHVLAAKSGAWISLDGLDDNNTESYVKMITNMRDNGLLGKVLVSHDAGWYRPGLKDGGEFRGFTSLFINLLPALKESGFTPEEINLLLVGNPAKAFTTGVRRVR